MTRASLLRILDHVHGISDDEIRDLEQLAAAFPYCQTAHVLLAKTAHDHGSMLAGQRLRRAATYAADRELLRRLLERPASPAIEAVPAASIAETVTADTQSVSVIATTEAAPAAPITLAAAASSKPAAPPEVDLFAVEVASAPVLAAETGLLPVDEPADPEAPTPAEDSTSAQHTAATETTTAAEELPTMHMLAAEPAATEPAGPATTAPVELSAVEATADVLQPAPAEIVTALQEPLAAASVTTAVEAATGISDEAAGEVTVVEELDEAAGATVPEASDELLPAVAPPIRPPSGAGISRFEFGLGQPRLPEPTGYRLLGIEEEDEDEEFDSEEAHLPDFRPAVLPQITAPFRADAELGYALGGGSRLGYDLQTRTPDGFALDLPLEAFFEPDALLLAHARAHQPAPKTSSLDLIDRFLKAQPRIKAGTAGVPPPAVEQADLSVRSNATAPALASESLAKIMVKQGKTAKAIEIYERLMAKQPEKMAYFAERIQQLQQAPE